MPRRMDRQVQRGAHGAQHPQRRGNRLRIFAAGRMFLQVGARRRVVRRFVLPDLPGLHGTIDRAEIVAAGFLWVALWLLRSRPVTSITTAWRRDLRFDFHMLIHRTICRAVAI